MNKGFIVAVFAIMVASAFGQGTLQVVVPNGLSNVEGNSSTTDPFTSSTFRFQQVFDASQFAFVGSLTCRIDSIWFRIDGNATTDPLYVFSGADIRLSTTHAAPDSLSAVFANNIGTDVRTIFNGAVSFGDIYQSGVSPQPFNQTVIATTPFFYVPSQGNLLLDIAAAGGRAFLPGGMDAQATVGDSISRVFSANGNSLSGTADSLGLVTRFDVVIVPEPCWLTLVAVGAVTLALTRRPNRGKRRHLCP